MHLKSFLTLLFIGFCTSSLQAADQCHLVRYAELPVTMSNKRPLVSGNINGNEVQFLADSGAFFSTLSTATAEKYHLKLSHDRSLTDVNGVGGSTEARVTTLKSFALTGFGDKPVRNVQFVVIDVDFDVAGVIGQNIIGFADTEYDLANGVIRLLKSDGCKKEPLAYWAAAGKPFAEIELEDATPAEPHLIGAAELNGAKIRVLFDTGAFRSGLTRKAAARVGITPESDDAQAAGFLVSGIGSRKVETSIARFGLLDLGGEQIKNAKLLISDIRGGELPKGADMVLGADFFLSHRVYIAAKQHKLYFTYNGGRVFDLGATAPLTAGNTTTTEATDAPAGAPQDAAGFKRRGAAFADRQDFRNAIADFDAAIMLDPADAETYYRRALAKLGAKQISSANDDLDAALRVNPQFTSALIQRGQLRLAADASGAREDFDAAIASSPDNPSVALQIIEIYWKEKRFNDELESLDAWLAKYPDGRKDAGLLQRRCWSRLNLNRDLDLALVECNGAVKASRNSVTLQARGAAFLKLGQFEKALDDYKAALKLQPRSAMSLYGKGIAELKAGKQAEGEQDLKAAVAINPPIADEFIRIGLAP